PVLENSRIQRGYPTAPRNAPIIYNFEGEEFDALVEALNNIEVDILESISEIYFRPTDNSMRRIHVFMNDGQEIVADYETFSEKMNYYRSEEHTSELQSRFDLVCRLLLE